MRSVWMASVIAAGSMFTSRAYPDSEEVAPTIPARSAAELRSVSSAYASAVARSAGRLLDDIVEQERRVLEADELSVDDRVAVVRQLREQSARFTAGGTAPDAAVAAPALARHRQRIAEARTEAWRRFDRILEVHMKGDLDVVEAIMGLRDRALDETPRPSIPADAPSRRGFDTGFCGRVRAFLRSDTPPLQLSDEFAPFASTLRGAADDLMGLRSGLRSAFERSRAQVLRKYDERRTEIEEERSLSPDARYTRLRALEAERAEFVEAAPSCAHPSWSLAVALRHEKQRATATARARAACDEIAASCLAESPEIAQAVLDVRDLDFPVPEPWERPRATARPDPTPTPSPFGRDRLVNGDCEEPPQGSGIPGWEIGSGGWTPEVDPQDGDHFFHPKCREAVAELHQWVDVSDAAEEIDRGGVLALLEGSLRCFDQRPGDQAQMILEYRDGDGVWLGENETSPEHLTRWDTRSVTGRVPVLTRTIRVTLKAIRRRPKRSKQKSNDAFFDQLSLVLTRG
ncbi:MAG: hypothetical protein ACF8XB_09015 [Planctomycetota bacterium JB042]